MGVGRLSSPDTEFFRDFCDSSNGSPVSKDQDLEPLSRPPELWKVLLEAVGIGSVGSPSPSPAGK